MKEQFIKELESTKEYFERSTRCLAEADAGFKATPESISVCHQIAHVARTIEWFVEGMTSSKGFDLNFEEHWDKVNAISSLAEARTYFSSAMMSAMECVRSMSEAELNSPLPAGLVMGGQPKYSAVFGIIDHTAHHRGALTVYSRLLGKTPAMPYMDM